MEAMTLSNVKQFVPGASAIEAALNYEWEPPGCVL